MSDFRYRAFISYSHQDKSWADWLHRALETYRVPRALRGQATPLGPAPRRLIPVFRDREELASATDLPTVINEALQGSACLIVLCSPHAARSRWVNEEVLAYKRLGREERIFALIVSGHPNAATLPGREHEECFPPALRFRLAPDGQLSEVRAHPVAADARPGKDGRNDAKLKLIAGMLGVGLDVLRQRELYRRNRRMTLVASVAAGIAVLTGALAIEALLARRAAERHQKQAEELVGFMLGDLNGKLGQMQRLDVMEAVDDRAMGYFRALPSGDVTVETLAQRATALERIGGVRTDQGHLQAAMESYQAALQISAALAQAAPANAERQMHYADDWVWVGKTFWSQGELEAAGRAFEAAQRVLQRAGGQDPRNTRLSYETATVDNDLGHVREAQGRLEEAAVNYQGMLGISRDLVARDSTSKDWTVELGMAHNNLGKLALMSGRLGAAIAEYRADDTIEAELSARDPNDNEQLENVVTAHAILGRTLALAGDSQTGMSNLTRSVELAARLVKFDPQNTVSQEDLALYDGQLARLKRLAGDLPAAIALTQNSLQIFSTLTKGDSGNTAWQREFAEAQTEQAAETLARGDAPAAAAQDQSALALLEPLLARQPQERSMVLATARARLQLAGATTDAALARRLRDDALREVDSVRSGREDPRLVALRAEALLDSGRIAEAQPVLGELARCGYRDPALLARLQRQHIAYAPQAAGTPHAEGVIR